MDSHMDPAELPDWSEAAADTIRYMSFAAKRRECGYYKDAWSRWEHYGKNFGQSAPDTFREWLTERVIDQLMQEAKDYGDCA